MQARQLLNLGSGAKIFDGWINVDHDDVIGWASIHKKDELERYEKCFVQDDMMHYMTIQESNYFDAIALIQVLDHFTPYDADTILAQCRRILKPGGRIRVMTEDMTAILQAWWFDRMDMFDKDQPDLYKRASTDEKLGYLLLGNLSLHQTYSGHKMIYSADSLSRLLVRHAFHDINRYGAGRSGIEGWLEEYDTQPSHSIILEGAK